MLPDRRFSYFGSITANAGLLTGAGEPSKVCALKKIRKNLPRPIDKQVRLCYNTIERLLKRSHFEIDTHFHLKGEAP